MLSSRPQIIGYGMLGVLLIAFCFSIGFFFMHDATPGKDETAPADPASLQAKVAALEKQVAELKSRLDALGGNDLLLADFEGPDYGPWAKTGDCFGDGPAHGTLDNQNTVTGFLGNGLVNTYLTGDGTQGTLTSPPFKIERHAITFLIGGGHHPGSCCLNLLVKGEVVRTATGKDVELLEWDSWDVSPWAGQMATLQIVDTETGTWGHINVDQITQTQSAVKNAVQRLNNLPRGAILP